MNRPILLMTWYLMRAELQHLLTTQEKITGNALDLLIRINEVRTKRRSLEFNQGVNQSA